MKIGIIGAGKIVPEFIAAAKKVPELELAAIGATPRGGEKLKTLAAQHGIGAVYTDCDRMIDEAELDAVYIAVPNDLHYPYAKKALEAGLSVICEKPFCSDSAQLLELIALSRSRGLWLFEAISTLYFPNTAALRAWLPRIGSLKLVEMNFTQLSSRYGAYKEGTVHPVFQPGRSGGTLMDVNVYNVHLATALFGAPEDVEYFANLSDGVDMSGTLILRYPGFLCTLTAAKDCAAPCHVLFEGDGGWIYGETATNWMKSLSLHLTDGSTETAARNEVPERLYYELRAFCDMVAAGDRAMCDAALEQSLLVQGILDEARRKAGVR